MNRVLVTFLLLVTIASCKEVTFQTPQPKDRSALSSIPKNIQGKYLTRTEDGELSKDTIVITEKGYHFGYFDMADRSKKNESYEQGVLSDTMVLKSYKGYYFLSLNENPEWILRVLKREKNGDLIYMAMDEKDANFNDFLNKLSMEIRVDSIQTEKETLYQIDPSASKLVELIDKGFFSETRLIKIPAKR
jgi:hypothetical protein